MLNVNQLRFVLEQQGQLWILLLLAASLGACVGSFLQACYFRIPIGKSVVWPGSACPSCQQALRWHDNLPIVGWLLLRGRCRYCRQQIPFRYLWMEILCGAWAFLLMTWTLEDLCSPEELTVLIFVGYTSLLLASIDFSYKVLPDAFTLTPLWLGMLYAAFFAPASNVEVTAMDEWLDVLAPLMVLVWLLTWKGWLRSWIWVFMGMKGAEGYDDWFISKKVELRIRVAALWITAVIVGVLVCFQVSAMRLMACLVMVMILLGARYLGRAISGREALGLGDVKLVASMAWFLGLEGALLACGLACCTGTIEALVRSGFKMKKELAFGTHLCFAWVMGMILKSLGLVFFV
jgi:leader peptidase (prepilin peptidase)/N-methyltransferase